MARIVQSLTQPTKDYDEQIQQSFVRDIDSIVQKLNTTFQQDIKEEAEAEAKIAVQRAETEERRQRQRHEVRPNRPV